ncbi:UNVERIFIED_CONTAM: hypothetical protein ACS92_00615 [Bacillus cereus]
MEMDDCGDVTTGVCAIWSPVLESSPKEGTSDVGKGYKPFDVLFVGVVPVVVEIGSKSSLSVRFGMLESIWLPPDLSVISSICGEPCN